MWSSLHHIWKMSYNLGTGHSDLWRSLPTPVFLWLSVVCKQNWQLNEVQGLKWRAELGNDLRVGTPLQQWFLFMFCKHVFPGEHRGPHSDGWGMLSFWVTVFWGGIGKLLKSRQRHICSFVFMDGYCFETNVSSVYYLVPKVCCETSFQSTLKVIYMHITGG